MSNGNDVGQQEVPLETLVKLANNIAERMDVVAELARVDARRQAHTANEITQLAKAFGAIQQALQSELNQYRKAMPINPEPPRTMHPRVADIPKSVPAKSGRKGRK